MCGCHALCKWLWGEKKSHQWKKFTRAMEHHNGLAQKNSIIIYISTKNNSYICSCSSYNLHSPGTIPVLPSLMWKHHSPKCSWTRQLFCDASTSTSNPVILTKNIKREHKPTHQSHQSPLREWIFANEVILPVSVPVSRVLVRTTFRTTSTPNP